MTRASEADWENRVLDLLGEPLMWQVKQGQEIAPGTGEREAWGELLIRPRLLDALRRLNPSVPAHYLQQAAVEIATPSSQDAITENYRVHRMLVDGYPMSYIDADGVAQNPTLQLMSPAPEHNDWLAVNQVTLRQSKPGRGEVHRRFDVVLYVNGMPLSIIELKSAGSAQGVAAAHAQLATYLEEFPLEFRFCVFTLASDGLEARYGTPFTPLNHFSPWNVDDDGTPLEQPRIEHVLNNPNPVDVQPIDDAVAGLYDRRRMLQLTRNFTAFDEGEHGLAKRIAKPHQFFAVTKAVAATTHAVDTDGRAGVVWHTQGSGKSMEMELYAGLVSRTAALRNPTLVVVTDRTELDGQLFDTFNQSLLLAEKPTQVASRAQLRDELASRVTGGTYFTTLQKFGLSKAEKEAGIKHPHLSDRRNIIVIVDEAHRSHYDSLDGYAHHLKRALPHATLIAFTGTPISFAERNTRDVFGDYIDIYDLSRAVDDGATVPVVFEPRLVKVKLAGELTPEEIDAAADEATLGLDETERAKIEASVAVMNAVYGAPERLEALAADIVEHWERRSQAMRPLIEGPGKAMIVGGTRELCARLYDEIVKLRPDWHDDDPLAGRVKVVYSGTPADPPLIRAHVRRDSENARVKARLKDPDDPIELVIVKDMMLTGFDAPPLHTLYLDRPLKGALLMQTLARVNRTFRGKADGLLVAYAPLLENLNAALAEYTATDQARRPVGRDIEEVAGLVETLTGELRELLTGCDWRGILRSGSPRAAITAATVATNYLRDPAHLAPDGKTPAATRFRELGGKLARAWAIAGGATNLAELRDEIAFYGEVRVWMAKYDAIDRQARDEPVPEEVRRLLRGLVAESTASGDVIDIYEAAGLPRLSLDDLGAHALERAQKAPNSQLAIEALRAELLSETRAVTRGNKVRQQAFSLRISEIMQRYTNQQLTAAEVIAALFDVGREVSTEAARGAQFDPPLTQDELAFYDAVAQNESARELQGDAVLAQIARELVKIMRRDIRTDWSVRAEVQSRVRAEIKRLLVKFRYPPDRRDDAIEAVMDQAEEVAPRFAAERWRGDDDGAA